jgi:hypothetical protein
MIYIPAHGSHGHFQTLNKWYYMYKNGFTLTKQNNNKIKNKEQLDPRYILNFKTIAPQCEVKIIVFTVLLIDAIYATFYFTLY